MKTELTPQGEIKNMSNLHSLVESLDNKQVLMIYHEDGWFAMSVFFYEGKGWMGYTNPFSVHPLGEMGYHNGSFTPYWDVEEVDFGKSFFYVVLDSYEDMCSELREMVMNDVQLDLTSDETTIGKILEDSSPLFGKPVKDMTGRCYVLTGVSSSMEDYYYDVISEHGVLSFISCCASLDEVGEDEVPEDLKIYLHDKGLVENIRNQHFGDPFCSDVPVMSI